MNPCNVTSHQSAPASIWTPDRRRYEMLAAKIENVATLATSGRDCGTQDSIPRAWCCVVGCDLLDMWQEFPIHCDDHALLALLSGSAANIQIKINGTHDPISEFLVDQCLDCLAIMCHCLVRAVNIGLFPH